MTGQARFQPYRAKHPAKADRDEVAPGPGKTGQGKRAICEHSGPSRSGKESAGEARRAARAGCPGKGRTAASGHRFQTLPFPILQAIGRI